MTTEQFLNSLRFIDNEIQALNLERTRISDQRQAILDLAQTFGGVPTGVCVQSMPGSKTESLGIRLALVDDDLATQKAKQYAERIRRKLAELLDRKLTALLVIEKIPDARHRALLMHRYINNLQWSTVADLMKYNEHYLRLELRKYAIEAYERAKE